MGSVSESAKEVSGLVVPAITVIAGVVVITKILPLVGGLEGLQKAIADIWKFLSGQGGGGGGDGQLQMEFSRSPHDFLHGENFGLAVGGLKPNTSVDYGWSTIGKMNTYTTDATGSFTSSFTILYTTAPGTYTVWFDQRPYGGHYIENTLRVLSSGMKLNTYTVKQGESFTATAAGLIPNDSVLYYSNVATQAAQLMTNEYGGVVFRDSVLSFKNPPGTYTVTFNQRSGTTFKQYDAVIKVTAA